MELVALGNTTFVVFNRHILDRTQEFVHEVQRVSELLYIFPGISTNYDFSNLCKQ